MGDGTPSHRKEQGGETRMDGLCSQHSIKFLQPSAYFATMSQRKCFEQLVHLPSEYYFPKFSRKQ